MSWWSRRGISLLETRVSQRAVGERPFMGDHGRQVVDTPVLGSRL